MKQKLVTFKVPKAVLEEFDAECQRRGYANRTEALRFLMREFLGEQETA